MATALLRLETAILAGDTVVQYVIVVLVEVGILEIIKLF